MIIPTLWVNILSRQGSDRYGQPVVGVPQRVRVAPVKLMFTDEATTVRTDSSGSHGSARETIADVVFLARVPVKIVKGDVIEIDGHQVEVIAIHPRYTASGTHDHNEFHCDAYA